MYRFPMPFFISKKKQRCFRSNFLFISSHRSNTRRGIEERSLASHIISINLPIKNHWYEPARDINDCLSVLHFATAHFATLWAHSEDRKKIKNKRWVLSTSEWLIFLPTNTTSQKWLARLTSSKWMNFLPSKFAWLLNFSSRHFNFCHWWRGWGLFRISPTTKCSDVSCPAAVFRNIVDAQEAPSPRECVFLLPLKKSIVGQVPRLWNLPSET